MTADQTTAVEELNRAINRCRTSGIGAEGVILLGLDDAQGLRLLVDEQGSEIRDLRTTVKAAWLQNQNAHCFALRGGLADALDAQTAALRPAYNAIVAAETPYSP